jgi:hypothetical protein
MFLVLLCKPDKSSFVLSYNAQVTDSNIRSAVVVDLVLGGALLICFLVAQSRSILYKFRLVRSWECLGCAFHGLIQQLF